jgi:hypothetical protein
MYARDGQGALASVHEALAVMDATLDYLNGPGIEGLEAPAIGDVLQAAGGLSVMFAAFRASALARFTAAEAHDADGYGSYFVTTFQGDMGDLPISLVREDGASESRAGSYANVAPVQSASAAQYVQTRA